MSHGDGWEDVEVQHKKDYPSVRSETITTIVDQYNCQNHMHMNSQLASVSVGSTTKRIKNGISKINTTILEDSTGGRA